MHKLLANLPPRTLKALGSSISPNEEVLLCITDPVQRFVDDGSVLIALSDRIVIVKKRKNPLAVEAGWLGGLGWVVNSFPYQQVTGIYVRRGLLAFAIIAVETASFNGSNIGSMWSNRSNHPDYLPNAIVVSKSLLERELEPQLETLRQIVRERGTKSQTQQPAAQAASSANLGDELERLAQLRASGVLTDAEFAAAKAKLLS